MRSAAAALVVLTLAASGCGGQGGSGASAAAPSTGASASASPQASAVPASAAPSAAPLPTFTSQATIDGLPLAVGIVSTDDAIWVLAHSTAVLARIDATTNEKTDEIHVGGEYASGLASVAGRLWTFAQTDGLVVGVDPATRKVAVRIKAGGDGDVFAAGDGSLWLLSGDSLTRVDPKSASVAATMPVPPGCSGALLVAGGYAWIGEAGHLCKVDEATGKRVGGLDVGAGTGWGMAWHSSGILAPTEDGGLVRIDPAGPTVAAVIPPPPHGTFEGATYSLGFPGEIAFIGPDETGAWVRYNGATAARLELTGTRPMWTLYAGLEPAVEGLPIVEAHGSLWIGAADSGTVSRMALPPAS